MSIFKNLTTDNLEASEDRVGGYEALPSGVYDATIKVAYLGSSSAVDSKAQSITVVADVNGREYRETVWITNRNGENFYLDKADSKKKNPLPGFTTIDDLCLLATGQPLAEQSSAEKTVKIYNYAEKKEIPTAVQVLDDLIGKTVKLAVLRQIVDKQKRNDAGKYENTGETRTENVIDKVFHAETGRTVNEYRHEVDPAEFLPAWETQNKGKDRNRAKGVVGAGGAGQSGTGRPTATKSLFGG